MPVTDAEWSELAASRDIIHLGMLADDVRRRLHGARTTYLRVTRVSADPGGPIPSAGSAGEVRIEGQPASREAAVSRIGEVRAVCGSRPLSAYSLADLEQLSAREGIT